MAERVPPPINEPVVDNSHPMKLFRHAWMRWFQGLYDSTTGYPEDFLDLNDTPTSYTGESGNVVVVKSTEDGLEFDTVSTATNNIFYGYNASGGTTIDADGEDLTITTEVREDSAYTHSSSSAEVEIQTDGEYEIIADASFNFNEDDIVEFSIYHDDGSGYSLVEGAAAYCGA